MVYDSAYILIFGVVMENVSGEKLSCVSCSYADSDSGTSSGSDSDADDARS